MKWNHLALTVRDQHRSKSFYSDVLGLTFDVHEDPDGMILRTDEGFELALLVGDPPEGRERIHFGFGLKEPDEVRSFRQRLMSGAAAAEVEWYDLETFVSVKFLDPDDYIVEVFWGKANHDPAI
jgi:catechol 2,3-dioxygenase-like lactoylglutathione lyase family enzyme